MPLPENFNQWEHLQSVLIRTYNKEVRESFRDEVDENDLASPEGALKQACLITDNDSAIICNIRMMFFYNVCGGFKPLISDSVYGIPKTDFHRDVKFKPQVILKFRESDKDAKLHNRQSKPKRMRISYRILEKTENITNADVTRLRNEIKTQFRNFKHFCGYSSVSYYSPDQGMGLKISCTQKNEGIELVKKICNIANVDCKEKLIKSHSDEFPDRTPDNIVILGETKKESIQITGTVYLQEAVLELHSNLVKVRLYP